MMLIARLADGNAVTYYDESLPPNLYKELSGTFADKEFDPVDPLLNVLKKQNLQFEVGHYRTYLFPAISDSDKDVHSLSRQDGRVKTFGFDQFSEQVYVIEQQGSIASACVSARENERCGEAWVFTAPEFRHQGYAQKVVRAWAGSLMEAGKVPFYSHRIDNLASANLAGKLGLHPVFEEIVISRRAS